MPHCTTRDGVKLFYKDWGHGRPVVFLHGWPLNGDAWEDQLKAVAGAGFRGIAHDRRGHGRSTPVWDGYDLDTFAHDLNHLLTSLDLDDVTLVGHSLGGGELARYIGRYGTSRVRSAVMVSTVTPLLAQRPDNPDGMPSSVFDALKAGVLRERSQFWKDTALMLYSAGRPGSTATQGNLDAFWSMAMTSTIVGDTACVDVLGYADLHADLKKFDIPLLVVHGGDDLAVPADLSSRKTAALVPGAVLKVYEGGSHCLSMVPGTKERFNQELLEFLQS